MPGPRAFNLSSMLILDLPPAHLKMQFSLVALLLGAQLASAHFELIYPYWRGDSFLPPASQYLFPCKPEHLASSPPVFPGPFRLTRFHRWKRQYFGRIDFESHFMASRWGLNGH